MTRPIAAVAAALAFVALAGACGKPAPTKENAIATLERLIEATERNELDAAASLLRLPGGVPAADVMKELPNALLSGEWSRPGLAKLAAEGKWGSYEEVFPNPDERVDLAELEIPIGAAYGMRLDRAEVGLYWDGRRFLVFRCDDLGTLVAPSP